MHAQTSFSLKRAFPGRPQKLLIISQVILRHILTYALKKAQVKLPEKVANFTCAAHAFWIHMLITYGACISRYISFYIFAREDIIA